VLTGDARERSLFNQYRGFGTHDGFFVLDVDFLRRDAATGTWTIVQARDLGLDSREVRAQYDRQGNFKIFGEYWELTRRYPRTINTGLEGAGTTTPVVNTLAVRGSGQDLDLKTDRKRATAGVEKWLGPNLLLEASFTNENKDGARIFGRGFTCPSGAAPVGVCTALATGANQWGLLMLPEPIDSTTRQFEAKATWHGERFSLAASYYGSFYDNHNGALVNSINGNLVNPLGNFMGVGGGVALTAGLRNILTLPMALPPDSEAHQFALSGTYGFAPRTRLNFKVAYTHATQNDDFLSNGLPGAPSGRSSYGGVLDTTLAQVGIVSRPWSRMTLNANLRYEDREDKSPLDLYNIEGANRYANGTYSLKKVNGKLEGSYLMGGGMRGTLGVDHERMDRGQFSSPECIDLGDGPCIGESIGGISALRAKTWETTLRAELRRTLADDMSGAIIFYHSKRDGSSWLKPNALPVTGATELSDQQVFSRTGIFPSIFMDRERNKVKVMTDWSPTENLSVQVSGEYGKDRYSAPTEKGLDRTEVKLAGVDVSYAINDNWKATAYYTYSEQGMNVAHSTGYVMQLKDRNNTAGVSIAGKPAPKWQFAADVLWINDRNIYNQGLDNLASAANVAFLQQSGGLPDVVFREMRLKFTGRYALARNSELRFDLIHDRQNLNEWTWGSEAAPFFYSDNTTVRILPRQHVTALSVGYTYRFR
jgi:MtrB/PioB family decaheme-associated outer membrane protein